MSPGEPCRIAKLKGAAAGSSIPGGTEGMARAVRCTSTQMSFLDSDLKRLDMRSDWTSSALPPMYCIQG